MNSIIILKLCQVENMLVFFRTNYMMSLEHKFTVKNSKRVQSVHFYDCIIQYFFIFFINPVVLSLGLYKRDMSLGDYKYGEIRLIHNSNLHTKDVLNHVCKMFVYSLVPDRPNIPLIEEVISSFAKF